MASLLPLFAISSSHTWTESNWKNNNVYWKKEMNENTIYLQMQLKSQEPHHMLLISVKILGYYASILSLFPEIFSYFWFLKHHWWYRQIDNSKMNVSKFWVVYFFISSMRSILIKLKPPLRSSLRIRCYLDIQTVRS